jgi:hypothetical protein
VRVPLVILIVSLLFLSVDCAQAQSPNASIRGIVLDPDARRVPGAEIIVVSDATGVKFVTATNGEGFYIVENLPPGSYRIQVSKFGFKGIIKPDIILNVQDGLSLNFTLPIGASAVTVTVEGGAPMMNTQSAAVSTVVDRNFVENMPLNGRSFQDLILLTPGVVTNSPQSTSYLGSSGEFSVNGQRTESNYYSVDGVGSNVGANLGTMSSTATSGSLPASSVLGTTQGLVSVDALQEFRIQSSTYSSEYGRAPGGQFSFVTRAGTNDWHGTAFNYLRNDYFDANDWFNDYYRQPEAALRQNDFGGTLGGPVRIPHWYNGIDKTFFFFSYEGLRLLQPQAATLSEVPTPALRQAAPVALQPALNGFPLPNCPTGVPNCRNDLGNGLGNFVGSWSNPSSVDSSSIRVDHALTNNEKVFFRYGDTPSNSGSRAGGNFSNPSDYATIAFASSSYTAGLASTFSQRFSNDLRFNYSSNVARTAVTSTAYGGSEAVSLFGLQGIPEQARAEVEVELFFPASVGFVPATVQSASKGAQKQWNLVDGFVFLAGAHELKFGVDYRRLNPQGINGNPEVQYEFDSAASAQSGLADAVSGQAFAAASVTYQNLSAYVQDEWHARQRLTISAGVRWEVNPPPSAPPGNLPYTAVGNTLSTLTLAPPGTPLWNTNWHSVAPRLGAAYVARNAPDFETVVRGGVGVFFDSGQQGSASGFSGAGFSASQYLTTPIAFPGPLDQVAPEIVNPPVAPYGNVTVFPRNLQLPYTWQTNVSVQQALGSSQTVTLSYVGAFARKLLELRQLYLAPINPQFSGFAFIRQNALTSDYNAFQVQYQRRLSRGLQALASYTMSHCLDYGSENNSLPYQRGNCDFDVRHNFSSAVSYELPSVNGTPFARAVLRHWAVDDRFMARTGFPVTLNGPTYINPATGESTSAGLNLIAGQPVYVYGAQFPGGRSINVAAFTPPVGCSPYLCPIASLGDAPRNFVRGFGAWQMDLALRREFPITERLKLQFRAEAFNIFNHPNFGTINAFYSPGSTTFGVASATLAQSLGVLSPLYQMGGPRSMQFALRLAF